MASLLLRTPLNLIARSLESARSLGSLGSLESFRSLSSTPLYQSSSYSVEPDELYNHDISDPSYLLTVENTVGSSSVDQDSESGYVFSNGVYWYKSESFDIVGSKRYMHTTSRSEHVSKSNAFSHDAYLLHTDRDTCIAYLDMVKENPQSLKDIPEFYQLFLICCIAVRQDPSTIDFVKSPSIRQMLKRLTNQDGQKEVTEPVFGKLSFSQKRSFSTTCRSMDRGDKGYRDDPIENLLKVLNTLSTGISAAADIYAGHGLKQYEDMIKKDPKSLKDIPTEFQTLEICLLATKLDPSTIQFIKDSDMKDLVETISRICNLVNPVVQRDLTDNAFFQTIKEVFPQMTDAKIEKIVIEEVGVIASIDPIYYESMTGSIEEYAMMVNDDPSKLTGVPKRYHTVSVCLPAIRKDRYCLDLIKDEYVKSLFSDLLRDRDTYYLDQVNKDVLSIKDIPKDFLTNDICMTAVTQNPKALEFIPKEMMTLEMCKIATYFCFEMLEHVSMEFQTLELCVYTILQHPSKKTRKIISLIKDPELAKQVDACIRKGKDAKKHGRLNRYNYATLSYQLDTQSYGNSCNAGGCRRVHDTDYHDDNHDDNHDNH